jgi:hypothetical protein
MELNINQLVRSGVILAVGLPITIAVAAGAMPEGKTGAERDVERLKSELTIPCLQWGYSAEDSRLERDAKTTIDEAFGGEGVNYSGVCSFVLK